MTVLTTIPNGASNRDIRDTLNNALANIAALMAASGGGTPTPSPTPTPTPTPAPGTFDRDLTVVGDSQTVNGGNPVYAMQTDYPGRNISVLAQTGRNLGTPANLNDGGNTVYGQLANIIAQKARMYIIHDGANTLGSYGWTSALWMERIQDIAQKIKAGVAGTSVFCVTPLPNGNASQASAGFEQQRQDVNTGLRAAIGGSWLTGILPYGQHPFLSDTTDATYFQSDQIHLKQAAYDAMKPQLYAVVNAFLAGSNAVDPSAFSLTDLNNRAVSTSYTSEVVVVSGLGPAVTVTASVTGGTMQARQGAFGAANVAGMVNGDAARLRATTAATSGTATEVVLSFGATSDTWTLTTQAAAGNQVTLATSSVPFTSNHNFDTAHTYTAVPFPAGRPLLLLEMNGGQAPFSIQINGVAAQVVISDGGRLVALGAAVLDAGSYDVKVTTGNPDKAFNAAIMHAGAITNAAAGNPVVGTASLGYQYRGDDDQAVGQAIAIPTSGLAVILYYNGTADFTLPTGYTLARDMGDGWYWITATASDTYHIKSNDYGNTMMLAMGFTA